MSYFLRNKTTQITLYIVVITNVNNFAFKSGINYINQS